MAIERWMMTERLDGDARELSIRGGTAPYVTSVTTVTALTVTSTYLLTYFTPVKNSKHRYSQFTAGTAMLPF